MLASLGHDPLLAVVALVVLNAAASHLGSVGMVVWFGFKGLVLGEPNILSIGTKASGTRRARVLECACPCGR